MLEEGAFRPLRPSRVAAAPAAGAAAAPAEGRPSSRSFSPRPATRRSKSSRKSARSPASASKEARTSSKAREDRPGRRHQEDADKIKAQLEKAGAKVELSNRARRSRGVMRFRSRGSARGHLCVRGPVPPFRLGLLAGRRDGAICSRPFGSGTGGERPGVELRPARTRGARSDMAQTFTGRKRVRKFFGHIREVAEMPNLIEVQKASYDQFCWSTSRRAAVSTKVCSRFSSPCSRFPDFRARRCSNS